MLPNDLTRHLHFAYAITEINVWVFKKAIVQLTSQNNSSWGKTTNFKGYWIGQLLKTTRRCAVPTKLLNIFLSHRQIFGMHVISSSSREVEHLGEEQPCCLLTIYLQHANYMEERHLPMRRIQMTRKTESKHLNYYVPILFNGVQVPCIYKDQEPKVNPRYD